MSHTDRIRRLLNSEQESAIEVAKVLALADISDQLQRIVNFLEATKKEPFEVPDQPVSPADGD